MWYIKASNIACNKNANLLTSYIREQTSKQLRNKVEKGVFIKTVFLFLANKFNEPVASSHLTGRARDITSYKHADKVNHWEECLAILVRIISRECHYCRNQTDIEKLVSGNSTDRQHTYGQ